MYVVYQQRSVYVIHSQRRPTYSWESTLQRRIWCQNVKRDLYMSEEINQCHISPEVYVCDMLITKETYAFVRVHPTTLDLIRKCQKRPKHVKRELQMPYIRRGLCVWYVMHKWDLYTRAGPLCNVRSDAKMSKETYTCQKRPINVIHRQRSMYVIYLQWWPTYSWGSTLQRQIWDPNVKRDLYISKETYKWHTSTEVFVCDINSQRRPTYSWGSTLQRQIWDANVKRDLYMSKETYKCHIST